MAGDPSLRRSGPRGGFTLREAPRQARVRVHVAAAVRELMKLLGRSKIRRSATNLFLPWDRMREPMTSLEKNPVGSIVYPRWSADNASAMGSKWALRSLQFQRQLTHFGLLESKLGADSSDNRRTTSADMLNWSSDSIQQHDQKRGFAAVRRAKREMILVVVQSSPWRIGDMHHAQVGCVWEGAWTKDS